MTERGQWVQHNKRHAILTKDAAIEIYLEKPTGNGWKRGMTKTVARALGKTYGVDEKTVRDIWNRRSWRRETAHLDLMDCGDLTVSDGLTDVGYALPAADFNYALLGHVCAWWAPEAELPGAVVWTRDPFWGDWSGDWDCALGAEFL